MEKTKENLVKVFTRLVEIGRQKRDELEKEHDVVCRKLAACERALADSEYQLADMQRTNDPERFQRFFGALGPDGWEIAVKVTASDEKSAN